MNIIIESTLNNLQKSSILLSKLSNAQLSNSSISPYYSSVGSHLRHILDFYDCIFNEAKNVIDLTARNRNLEVETCCEKANSYLDSIINKIKNINDIQINKTVEVIDDLGLGKTKIPYTLSALLAQANSHTIHHYAIINYILDRLNIVMEDLDFGYNPTTPKPVKL
ncbi:MAG: hypothetical protein ACPG6B_06605 [Oceanihabitans sp.]